MKVLVLNSGSSSLKFQLISTDPDRITKSNDERDASGMAGVRAATDMHAVGHRVVHGSELFADSRELDTFALPNSTSRKPERLPTRHCSAEIMSLDSWKEPRT